MNSLVRYALDDGGDDYNIMFPKTILGGGFSAGNPSCAVFGGDLVFNTRMVNYRKILQSDKLDLIGLPKNQTYFLHRDGFDSRNALFWIDGGRLSGFAETDYGKGGVSAYYRGFEDCRLVVWDGSLYAYGTRWDKVPGEGRICLYRLDEGMSVVSETVVQSPFGAKCEKNWAAVEGRPFCFIYMYNPMTIVEVVDLSTGECMVVRQDGADGSIPDGLAIKGSTPVVSVGDGTFLSIVHTTDQNTSPGGMECAYYRSAFVLLDNGLNIKKTSGWFVFRTDLCEFTCGIALHDGFVWIPYSQVDCTVNILKMPLDSVLRLIHGTEGEYPLYGPEYVRQMADRYEVAEQFSTSFVLHNMYAAMTGVGEKQGALSAAKAFSGIVMEFPNLVEPGFVMSVESRVLKALADSGGNKALYRPLSDIARFQGRFADAERYCRFLTEFETLHA